MLYVPKLGLPDELKPGGGGGGGVVRRLGPETRLVPSGSMVDSGRAGAGIVEKLVEERDFLGDWEGAMASGSLRLESSPAVLSTSLSLAGEWGRLRRSEQWA
jgi:hypothetical protein